MRACVIWDMCETLADTKHRLPFILNEPADWPAYDARIMSDTPIPHAAMVFKALHALHMPQIILTGRNERTRGACTTWMNEHGLPFMAMYMRPHGVEIPSAALKRRLICQARKDGWHPILAFEDEPATVRMYRQIEGVPVFAADDFSWTTGKFKEVRRHADAAE